MAKPKKATRLFTDVVETQKDFSGTVFRGMEGDTVYEVVVVRKFKLKMDENGDCIFPEAK